MKIKLIDKNCEPYRAYATDSGMDLRARLKTALVIHPMHIPEIEYVDRLSDSERGAKGFGSTGVS